MKSKPLLLGTLADTLARLNTIRPNNIYASVKPPGVLTGPSPGDQFDGPREAGTPIDWVLPSGDFADSFLSRGRFEHFDEHVRRARAVVEAAGGWNPWHAIDAAVGGIRSAVDRVFGSPPPKSRIWQLVGDEVQHALNNTR